MTLRTGDFSVRAREFEATLLMIEAFGAAETRNRVAGLAGAFILARAELTVVHILMAGCARRTAGLRERQRRHTKRGQLERSLPRWRFQFRMALRARHGPMCPFQQIAELGVRFRGHARWTEPRHRVARATGGRRPRSAGYVAPRVRIHMTPRTRGVADGKGKLRFADICGDRLEARASGRMAGRARCVRMSAVERKPVLRVRSGRDRAWCESIFGVAGNAPTGACLDSFLPRVCILVATLTRSGGHR